MCYGFGCKHENRITGECEKPVNDPCPCTTTFADKWEDSEELPDVEELDD